MEKREIGDGERERWMGRGGDATKRKGRKGKEKRRFRLSGNRKMVVKKKKVETER